MVAKFDRANVQEIDNIRSQIRKTGARATPARIAVLQLLQSASSPVTHADLSDRLVPLGFDKATVFRNLSDLTEAGLVSRTELGDHVWRFESVFPEHPQKSRHPHFVCTECGRVECLETMEFTALSKRKVRGIGRISEILLKGECSTCVSNAGR